MNKGQWKPWLPMTAGVRSIKNDLVRNLQIMQKIEKIIGYSELIFAALAGILGIASFKTAFFPSKSTHWEAPGWALMNLILISPLALSVGVSGLALVKSFRRKWLYHILPIIVVIGIIIFFWWADIGSMK